MPFDPSLPAPNAPLQSQVVRDQLQALFNLINDVPVIGSAAVDSITTLPPGDPATASVSVTGNTLHFTFSIPGGAEGMTGPQGEQGPEGPAGPPGEVTQSDLDYVINNNTSNISNGVGTLGLFVSDPPTQNDVQLIADRLDELINALRR